MGVITWNQAVDIGGGRGRLAPAAAASLARVDVAMRSAFGRAADINEAWRSPEQADKNYAAYLRYLNGGPWAPIALPGNKSVHCFGEAVDTDDTSDAQMRIWNDHGWYWTVYRDGKLVERWHLEYFANRDNHRHEGAPASSVATPVNAPQPTLEEEDMNESLFRIVIDKAWYLCIPKPGGGFHAVAQTGSPDRYASAANARIPVIDYTGASSGQLAELAKAITGLPRG